MDLIENQKYCILQTFSKIQNRWNVPMMWRGHFPVSSIWRAHQEGLGGPWFSRDILVLDVSCAGHPPNQTIAALLCGNKPGGGGQLSLLPCWKGPKTVCEEMPPVFVPGHLWPPGESAVTCHFLSRVPAQPPLPWCCPLHRALSSGQRAEQGPIERSTALPL